MRPGERPGPGYDSAAMTSMWVNHSDWSASWKVSAGSQGTLRQMRAISSQLGPPRPSSALRCRQALRLVGVAAGEGAAPPRSR